ncbi:hypothetical protein J3E69DRAFT_331495 [Trichoderma sp. SZMC 28015]
MVAISGVVFMWFLFLGLFYVAAFIFFFLLYSFLFVTVPRLQWPSLSKKLWMGIRGVRSMWMLLIGTSALFIRPSWGTRIPFSRFVPVQLSASLTPLPRSARLPLRRQSAFFARCAGPCRAKNFGPSMLSFMKSLATPPSYTLALAPTPQLVSARGFAIMIWALRLFLGIVFFISSSASSH